MESYGVWSKTRCLPVLLLFYRRLLYKSRCPKRSSFSICFFPFIVFSFRPRTVSLLIQTAGKSKIRLCFFTQPPLPHASFYLLYHCSRGASSLTPLVYYSLRTVFVCSSKRACIQAGCSYLVYVSLALGCGGLLMLGFFFRTCPWLCSV